MKTRLSAPKSMGIRREVGGNSAGFNARQMFKDAGEGEARTKREGGNYSPRVFKQNNVAAQSAAQQCRWPMGDPLKAGFHFCERMSIPGMSYCYDHACLAYQGSKKKSPSAPKEDNAPATETPDTTGIAAVPLTH